MTRSILTILALFTTSCFAMSATAAPLPEALRDMVGTFTELESEIRDEEWEQAEEELALVKSQFGTLETTLMKSAPDAAERAKVKAFGAKATQLEDAIGKKSRSEASDAASNLQAQTLKFVNWFEFDRHPLLEFFAEELEEMAEELEMDEILSEVDEMDATMAVAGPGLAAGGVDSSTIDSFVKALKTLRTAASNNDVDSAKASLEQLSELTATMLKRG